MGANRRFFDVFNGDADGICSLHQLRLADPLDATLVTGRKRDIELLQWVPAADGDVVTVLDISLDRNRPALEKILATGAVVRYFDHHFAGAVPVHPNLTTVLDDSRDACTSALVDRHLAGRFRAWAVVGAFGDGSDAAARKLAQPLTLDPAALGQLRELGVTLNYAAYGQSEADMLALPADLYRTVRHHDDPFELLASEPLVALLDEERRKDLERTRSLKPMRVFGSGRVWMLPDAAWARRVHGTFANRLSRQDPSAAVAVLTPRADGAYVVSVRAPAGKRTTAVQFCRTFPNGGGRKASAGIDRLEPEALPSFLGAFETAWGGEPGAA
jgi:hypothetical protein